MSLFYVEIRGKNLKKTKEMMYVVIFPLIFS